MASTWTEYLRLSQVGEGTALLELCMYEGLAEQENDYDEEVLLPEEIDGKKVVGVEDGIIFGGELSCYDSEKAFSFTEDTLTDAIEWLKARRWNIAERLVHELRSAVKD